MWRICWRMIFFRKPVPTFRDHALAAAALCLSATCAMAQTGQIGVASVYWQSQRVAAGERFMPDDMTAAHPKLPFGALVQVTRVGTKRSVVVKINDRGPFIRGRIIDLSRGAGRALGVSGLARVRLEVVQYGAGRPLEPAFAREAYQHLERLTHTRESYPRDRLMGDPPARNIASARLIDRTDSLLRYVAGLVDDPVKALIVRARTLLSM